MITISRALARKLRAVFRRALNLRAKERMPTVRFRAGPEGLHVRCRHQRAAVEFRADGDLPADELNVPFNLFAECQARRNEPVTLERNEKVAIVARWQDSATPQTAEYDVPQESHPDAFPSIPDTLTENPPRLLQSLHDALEMTDRQAVRYATDRIRLEGSSGRILATVGRQMLVQTGFEFPFSDNLLFPFTNVFGCRELPQDEAVLIGKRDDCVSLQIGGWTLHYTVEVEGRYPDLDSLLKPADAALATCRLADADADFLLQAIKQLPVGDTGDRPVTFDLNGTPAIRAVGESQSQPVELALSRSEVTGQPLRISANRDYLLRAVRLGFRRFCLYGAESPVVCHDEQRSYVWAVLGAEDAVEPSPDAVRIDSGDASASGSSEPPSTERQSAKRQPSKSEERKPGRKRPAMSQSRTKRDGRNSQANRPDAEPVGTDALIAQAEAVRASLSDAAAKSRELIAALKRHRKQAKLVQSTIASLRQLPKLEV